MKSPVVTISYVVNCPELENPANGRVILNNRSEGSEAMYSCDGDYVLSEESIMIRVCGPDGRWSGEQPQCSELY